MGAALNGIIFDDLEWPKPGFQGHGILKSRISRRWCESFQLYKAQLITIGLYRKRVVAENFLLKRWKVFYTTDRNWE